MDFAVECREVVFESERFGLEYFTIHIGVTRLSYTHLFSPHKKYFLNTLGDHSP